MKKILTLTLVVLLISIPLTGCGSNGDDTTAKDDPQTNKQQEVQPPDLTGEWKQINGNSEDNYQIAVIKDDTIEVYWVDATTDTQSLYWAGSYIAPATADDTYSWDSANDKEKTDSSLMASGDDLKTFTYSDKQLSYSVSAMGSTQTVKLEKK